MSDVSSDDFLVFKALGEQRRCTILELIKEKPRTTGDLCKHFEGILSRSRVMQYIGMLKQAALIVARTEERYKMHYLNPEMLPKLREGWIASFVGALPINYHSTEISEEKVLIFKALSNANRRIIVNLLRNELCVTTDLCKEFEGSVDHYSVMKHIKVLRRANVIICLHRGRNQWNQLKTASLKKVYDYLFLLYNSD